MNSKKESHELQKENSRDEQRAWKDRASDGLPIIRAFSAIFDQQPGESTSSKLRNLDMRIRGS